MNKAAILLESIRDFEIEKYDAENEFKQELDRLIIEKYDGDFSTFMSKEVLNEDYGSLGSVVTELYNR